MASKMNKLIDILKKHEGLRLKPYLDSVGKLTIGVGRNLDDNGIRQIEAEFMLENDIKATIKECEKFTWFDSLNEARKTVIISMVFNIGMPVFKTFKKTISHIETHDFFPASVEMMRSRWADQVGNRAVELSKMMQTGNYV